MLTQLASYLLLVSLPHADLVTEGSPAQQNQRVPNVVGYICAIAEGILILPPGKFILKVDDDPGDPNNALRIPGPADYPLTVIGQLPLGGESAPAGSVVGVVLYNPPPPPSSFFGFILRFLDRFLDRILLVAILLIVWLRNPPPPKP